MNNIQRTAIRLIANAFLFSREKDRNVVGYRFDSSLLTQRGITSVKDIEALQEELNRRGWCFNILTFNDFVIQDKTFLAEMTKLGCGRIKDKTDEEIKQDYLSGMHKRTIKQLVRFLGLGCKTTNMPNNLDYSCELTTDINSEEMPLDDGITINTPNKRFWLNCSTRTYSWFENDETAVMKITFSNEDMKGVTCEFALPASSSLMRTNCSMLIRAIRNNLGELDEDEKEDVDG